MSIFKKSFKSKPSAPRVIFNRFLLGFVLTLTLTGQTLYAQQSDADAKKLAEIRSKAEKGEAEAQVEFGRILSQGKFGVTKDEVEAVKWFRKAAEQNFFSAQNCLGFCYLNGIGVEKDEQEGLKWYRKAAEQNFYASQFNLGFCYYNGIGVAKDDAEAVKWYRKAAEQNFATAQATVGECYFRGIGVAKDMAEAYKWFLLAAAQGEEDAKSRVRHLEKKLKKDQIAEVKKQVAEWTKQYEKAAN